MTNDPNQVPRDPREQPPTPANPQTPPPDTPGAGYGGAPQEPTNPGAYRPPNEPYGTPPPAGPSEPYGGAYGGGYGGQNGPTGAYPPPPSGVYGGAAGGAGAYGAAYAAPLGQPVPAGMSHIWQKWINVTTKPGVASFRQELPTANWSDIWISLIALGILSAITGAIAALYTVQNIAIPQGNGTTTIVHIPAGVSWFTIIWVPLAFFIGVAILFVVAKIFGGTGTFLQQSYAMALFYVPIQGVTALLGLLPVLGGIASIALGIYEIVLAVFAIAASQRLTVGKSVAVVLLPAAIVFFFACAALVVFAAILATTFNAG
jgi:Yip1 domain